jgi:hypothetical protein
MLKVFRGLLGNTPAANPAKKRTSKAVAKRPTTRPDYRAVSVAPGKSCCSAANMIAGKRHLFTEVPRLPLADCTIAPNCACTFKKVSDRRDGERRQSSVAKPSRPFEGPEKRKRAARRSVKA